MSKKEFYEKYIKDDRTEDEKIMQIIHENARKGRNNKTHAKRTNQRINGVSMLLGGILMLIGVLVGAICL